jgi:ribosome-associated translation inhibitor RaiA
VKQEPRQPPEIIVRKTELPSPLRTDIEDRIQRLCDAHPIILRCHVTIEGPGGHHRQGQFQLRIRITVPGRELEVSRQTGDQPEVAVREAFAAARRRVREKVHRLQRKVKSHATSGRRRSTRGVHNVSDPLGS